MKHKLRICHSEPLDFSQYKLREESLPFQSQTLSGARRHSG